MNLVRGYTVETQERKQASKWQSLKIQKIILNEKFWYLISNKIKSRNKSFLLEFVLIYMSSSVVVGFKVTKSSITFFYTFFYVN